MENLHLVLIVDWLSNPLLMELRLGQVETTITTVI